MCDGGVILVHDFFGADYPGVKAAVSDFEKYCKEHTEMRSDGLTETIVRGRGLKILPIGDSLSVAIIK
jgi:hypothetical protein